MTAISLFFWEMNVLILSLQCLSFTFTTSELSMLDLSAACCLIAFYDRDFYYFYPAEMHKPILLKKEIFWFI